MSFSLALLAVLCFAGAALVFPSIRSDIQLGILATCLVGGFVLMGLAGVSAQIADLIKRLEGRR